MQVDAIEEGKIVRVSEEYAKREGLFILKKVVEQEKPVEQVPKWKKKMDEERRPLFDDYRKSLHKAKEPMLSELVDNFHWVLLEKRKAKNITRKQLAQSVGASEVDIKMLENGVLPGRDFVLVNKLEKFYGINIRKGAMNYQDSFRSKTNSPSQTPSKESKTEPKRNVQSLGINKEENSASGSDIDILDL